MKPVVTRRAAQLPTALRNIAWSAVRAQAKFVAKAYVAAEDVDEAVNEGLHRVLAGTAPWDPASGVALSDHVAKVGIAAVRVSARKFQRRSAEAVRTTVVDSMAPPPSSPEVKVMRSESAKDSYNALVRHFAGDKEALVILACLMGSITEPMDQAAHTGLDIETVRNVRKRVDRRIEAFYEGAAT